LSVTDHGLQSQQSTILRFRQINVHLVERLNKN